MTTNQELILQQIANERAAQNELFGKKTDDLHSANDWIAILARHLGLAASDAAKIDIVRYRRQLIRLAAVAVAAAESLDRKEAGLCAGQYKAGSGF